MALPNTPTNLASIHSLATVNLTKDNYLLQKTQIIPYLRGQRLFGYVDGTISAPKQPYPTPIQPPPPLPPQKFLTQNSTPGMTKTRFSNTLAAIGQALQSHEFTAYLFGGINPSYDAILRLEQQRSALDATVNVATWNDQCNRGGKSQQNQRSSQPQQSYNNPNSRSKGHGGHGRESSLQSNSSNLRPSCQVCGKTGQIAIQCYYCLDHAYQGGPPTMTAYMTLPLSTLDTNRYPNTGSTNRLTNDLQNLNLHSEPYHGGDQIHVGDGAGLPIKNVEPKISSFV
ncbi:hypothetical protein I3760_15G111100 [Carya illinoinensis]|nr:hypothetical protein I3760_15G111100 [Carya illinoinensis]